ncbi:MAG: Hpt domain-containing protein [Bernardetiaceae bacterium]|nr:Hpt domain-containing protein [Bernardetiaceae bacterium]
MDIFARRKIEHMGTRFQIIHLDADLNVLSSCETIFAWSGLSLRNHIGLSSLTNLADVLWQLPNDTFERFERVKLLWQEAEFYCDLRGGRLLIEGVPCIELCLELSHSISDELRLTEFDKINRLENEQLDLINENAYLRKALHEHETQEQERMLVFKRDFLAKISQEFRHPVNGIGGLSNLLAYTPPDSSDFKTYLRAISGAADYLDDLLSKIMDWARIESGKMRFVAEPFDIEELLRMISAAFEYQYLMHKINLNIRMAPSIPTTLYGDANRLSQILFGLLGSLIKCSEQGNISLGINPVRRDKKGNLVLLFELESHCFLSEKQPTRPLGFALISKLIALQGGTVEMLESQNPHILSFSMPFKPLPEVQKEHNDTQKTVICVCLSEKIDTSIARNELEAQHLVIEELNTLTDYKKYLKTDNRQPLFIVDWKSIEILSEMERTAWFEQTQQATKLLVVSADKLRDVPTVQFQDYIYKPINPKQLIKKIKSLLQKKAQPQAPYNETLDLTAIYEIVDGEQDMVVNLLQILKKNLKDYPAQMQQELAEGDLTNLRKTAHKFKSCTAYTGLHEFNQTLSDIESSHEENLAISEIEVMVQKIAEASKIIAVQVDKKITVLS